MNNSPAIRMDRANWIVIAVVIAAAVGYMTLLFLPKMRQVSAAHDELERKLEYVLVAQKSARASNEIQRQLDDVRAYLDKHGHQLMSEAQLPALFSQISHISKAHDAITTKFEPRPPVEYQSFRKASLALGVQADFDSLYDMLQDLESQPMRIWVEDVKIRGPREKGKTVECDLTLVVFVDNPTKTD
jgi:Tfp pilus assembly protein PilO